MATKEKIYSGKTKDIYRQPNGNLWIVFKDDVTGENGVVDPGANSVMGRIKGKGRMSLEMTHYYFQKFKQQSIPTHIVSVDMEQNALEAREADPPGKAISPVGGLEFICRRMAYGSFLRRYQKYVSAKMQNLNFLIEITLKDDERGDPLINDDAIVTLGLLNRQQLETAKEHTRMIAGIIDADLQAKALSMIDLKIEFGLIEGDVYLIDEVSADSMRVMDKHGNILTHEELYARLFPA